MPRPDPEKIRTVAVRSSVQLRNQLIEGLNKHVGVASDKVSVYARKYQVACARGLVVNKEDKKDKNKVTSLKLDSFVFKVNEVEDGTGEAEAVHFDELSKIITNLGKTVSSHCLDNEQSGIKGFRLHAGFDEEEREIQFAESDNDDKTSECDSSDNEENEEVNKNKKKKTDGLDEIVDHFQELSDSSIGNECELVQTNFTEKLHGIHP